MKNSGVLLMFPHPTRFPMRNSWKLCEMCVVFRLVCQSSPGCSQSARFSWKRKRSWCSKVVGWRLVDWRIPDLYLITQNGGTLPSNWTTDGVNNGIPAMPNDPMVIASWDGANAAVQGCRNSREQTCHIMHGQNFGWPWTIESELCRLTKSHTVLLVFQPFKSRTEERL